MANNLDLNAARDDEGGSAANQNSNTFKAPVRSPPPEYQQSVFHEPDTLPPNESTGGKIATTTSIHK